MSIYDTAKGAFKNCFVALKKCINILFQVAYPNKCIFCGDLGTEKEKTAFICEDCQELLEDYRYFNGDSKDFIFIFKYQGIIRFMLHRFKFHYHPEYGNAIADIIAKELARADLLGFLYSYDYIVPVPIHPKKLKNRGFNQVTIIAEVLAELINIPCCKDILIRIKNTKPQFSIKSHQRGNNVKNAFITKEKDFFKGKSVILLDDIYTTGNTALECKSTLLADGAERVLILVFSRTV